MLLANDIDITVLCVSTVKLNLQLDENRVNALDSSTGIIRGKMIFQKELPACKVFVYGPF